jgi:RHS repeat-associated protein
LENPVHVYTRTGSFTVILTATAGSESDVETKTDYVTVSAAVGSELVTRTITYTYDSLYRLTGADYSSGEEFAYAYDAVGNMTALTATITNTVVTTRVYDAANRLITVTTDGVARTLEWSDVGELLRDGDPSTGSGQADAYAWDAAGRLVRARVDGMLNRYAYLGDGGRISMTVGSETTTYTLDLASLLVQVLVAHEPARPEPTSYLYGVARIGEYDGAWRYHLADHLGSVRSLAGANGDVVGTQAYRPYGSSLSSTGNAGSAYGFTGEQADSTGLIYLRARMYAPALGQFMNRDLWSGDIERPMTFNGFDYAGANPINRVDPSGLWWCQYVTLDGDPIEGLGGCEDWVDEALTQLSSAGNVGKFLETFFHSKDRAIMGPDEGEWCGEGRTGIQIDLILGPDNVTGGGTDQTSFIRIYVEETYAPTPENVTTFGHEISHMRQIISGGNMQGEVLAYIVQWHLAYELGAKQREAAKYVMGEDPSRSEPVDPWSVEDLWQFYTHFSNAYDPVERPNYYIDIGPFKFPRLVQFPGERESWLEEMGITWPPS